MRENCVQVCSVFELSEMWVGNVCVCVCREREGFVWVLFPVNLSFSVTTHSLSPLLLSIMAVPFPHFFFCQLPHNYFHTTNLKNFGKQINSKIPSPFSSCSLEPPPFFFWLIFFFFPPWSTKTHPTPHLKQHAIKKQKVILLEKLMFVVSECVCCEFFFHNPHTHTHTHTQTNNFFFGKNELSDR